MSNIGNLVGADLADDLEKQAVPTVLQQTLQCHESGIVAKEFGGHVAYALAADDEQFRVSSFSIGGMEVLLTSSTVDYDTSSSTLQEKFYQVARIISVREKRSAEWDFFFVKSKGWDHQRRVVVVSHLQSHLGVGWGRQVGPMVSVAVVGLLAGNVVPARVQRMVF